MSQRINQTTLLRTAVFVLAILPSAEGRIIYVDGDAIGTNDGSSWESAYSYLQDGLADANSTPKPVEIRVAQGIYRPDLGAGVIAGDQMATFQLINGVTLRGGYAGFGELDPDTRNVELYETVLSGDLAGNDQRGSLTTEDNSCWVVTASHSDQDAVLDGFTVTAENRYPPACNDDDFGAAAVLVKSGQPTIIDCTFYNGDCGIWNAAGSPAVIDCVFNDISGCGVANTEGGGPVITNCISKHSTHGVYNAEAGHAVVTDCTFEGNDSGVSIDRSSATLANCVFKYSGDCGVDAYRSDSLALTNCTFEQNCDGPGSYGAIRSLRSSLKLTDCAFIRNNVRAIYNLTRSSLTLSRCRFVGNVGNSAIRSTGDATLYDCTFEGNSTRHAGGAISGTGNLALYNCRFSGNSARRDAGAIDALGNLTAIGCIFSGNSVEWGAGAISAGRAVLSHCTFAGNQGDRWNTANAIEPMGSSPSSMKLVHCIIWNGEQPIGMWPTEEPPVTITYSNIQGGWPGEGNIEVDPCFVDPGYWADANDPKVPADPNDPDAIWIDGDYHLQSQAGRWDPNPPVGGWVQDDVTSLCIDAGNPMLPIGHEPFPNGGIVNMGAYGGTAEASKSYSGQPVCENIVAGDINGDCQVNGADFAVLASHWLARGSDFVNVPPTVSIVAPLDGEEFYYPTPITIRVDATDPDGSVIWVRLTMTYSSNSSIRSRGCSATEGPGGWRQQWYWWGDTGVPFEGDYAITAKASDNDCAVSLSPPVVVRLHVP